MGSGGPRGSGLAWVWLEGRDSFEVFGRERGGEREREREGGRERERECPSVLTRSVLNPESPLPPPGVPEVASSGGRKRQGGRGQGEPAAGPPRGVARGRRARGGRRRRKRPGRIGREGPGRGAAPGWRS